MFWLIVELKRKLHKIYENVNIGANVMQFGKRNTRGIDLCNMI